MNTLKLTLAALAVGLSATSVQARDQQVELAVKESELRTQEGTASVLLRLRKTARTACAASAFVPRSVVRECREDVEAQFLTQLDNARLYRMAGHTSAAATQKGA